MESPIELYYFAGLGTVAILVIVFIIALAYDYRATKEANDKINIK